MKFLAAVCQMSSGEDVDANIRRAMELVRQAADRGAQLVVLPEVFTCYGNREPQMASAESVPGPTTDRMAALARDLGITLVAGSIFEVSGQADRCYNTAVVIGPDGRLTGTYRKMHLFDATVSGRIAHESDVFLPGERATVIETDFGPMGVAICFDLRFPDQFQAMRRQGARFVTFPSAFTLETGRDHWAVLLRARAIETQSYLIAANRWGPSDAGPASYGHSMIVSPWGTVLAQCADGEAVAVAEVDIEHVEDVRRRLPMRQPPHKS